MATTSEVTAADIARIAGVGRAAVSNWRRRHHDFPQPIGGPATSPTFSLDEVQQWLNTNGRAQTVNTRTMPDRQSSQHEDTTLAESMAALLPQLRAGVVLDPACGTGRLLRAAAARLGPKVSYIGQHPDGNGGYPQGSPLAMDALADYRLAADAVICAPPSWPIDGQLADRLWEFGPPPQIDIALAWLQLCFAYVKPGGFAAILMPFSAAVRASGRRVRAELLRSGCLRRVIALPQGASRFTNTPLQIWVLERPTARPSYTVAMVDLGDADPNDLPLDPHAWNAVFADPARSRDVPAIELLDDDVRLVPATHIEPSPRDYAAELAAQTTHYQSAASAVGTDTPTLAVATAMKRLPMVTIADLARLGALEFADRQGPLQSGDVVIAGGGNRFDATVVDTNTERHERPAEVLRCDPEQLAPHFVACFLRSEANRRQAAGTLGGTFRLDVRRARIPRIPLDEQRPYADAYRTIMDFAGRAETIAATAAEVAHITVDGLTAGTLLPTDTKIKG